MSVSVTRTALEALNCKKSAQRLQNTANYAESSEKKIESKGSPLLNRFYHIRIQLMNMLTRTAVGKDDSDQVRQLLILGGGLDTTLENMLSDKVSCFVVDLPEIIEQRELRRESNSKLIRGNLASIRDVIQKLDNEGFDPNLPTLIILECVLCYLDETSRFSVLKELGDYIKKAQIIIYDPGYLTRNEEELAHDGFIRMMIDSFARRGAPLLSGHNRAEQQIEEFYESNWSHCLCLNLLEASSVLLTPLERSVPIDFEPFDEFSSLLILLKRYFISYASNCRSIFDKVYQNINANIPSSQLRMQYRMLMAERRLIALERKQANNNTQQFIVREVQERDRDEILHLYEKSFSEFTKRSKSIEKYVKQSLKDLSSLSRLYLKDDSLSRMFIVEHSKTASSKRIVGCIGLRHNPKFQSSEIVHFCVDEDVRRKSLGQMLFDKLKEYAKTHHLNILELTVLDCQIPALNFYAKNGFQPQGTQEIGNSCTIHRLKWLFQNN